MTGNSTAAYDRWHAEYAAIEADGTHLYPWHRSVLRHLPDLAGLRVLEVGCGRGDFALALAARFPTADISAIDFSPAAIDIARTRSGAGAKVQFSVGDATALCFDAGAFDFVVSCECLEHIPQPGRMASEMARVLRPGGRFILTTENYLNGMLIGWVHCWLTRRPFNSGAGVQPHENFFLYPWVKRTLRKGGLRVERTDSTHFQWLLLPGTSPDRLCTEDFSSPFLHRLFRPFGRHFTFIGSKPR